jgi:two-component system chemotaxis sensor kinase CheA
MDDQYLDAFIRESEEAITELNNALLSLESDPADQEAMGAIFRTAHTLKGNFGAMGFEAASELAHAIEDLLDEMRQDELAVTPDTMDHIFAGVDQIEVIVGEIDETGESQTDTSETVADIRGLLDGEDGPTDTAEGDGVDGGSTNGDGGSTGGDGGSTGGDGGSTGGDGGSTGGDGESTNGGGGSTGGDGESTNGDGGDGDGDEVAVDGSTFADAAVDVSEAYHVRVDIGDSSMKGVDGMLVVEDVDTDFELLAADPERTAIEDGEYDEGFDLLVDAPDEAALAAALDDSSKIAASGIETVSEFGGDEGGDGRADDSADSSVDEIKSVRIDVDRLDELYGQVEQLVTSRIKLRRAVDDRDMDAAGENLNELDKISANLQNTVMDMRLIPLKKVVGKFPRLVRDLARELDKEVTFEISGEDIELDRTILTEISDPLMHILRNAVDHGIEPPDERESLGKPREGTIELRATRERDHVVIEVEDDGGGLDIERIREQAVQQGVRSADELEEMDDSEVYDLVFHPGFSTSEEVTDTSGRGVGMDVVHDTVTRLDGSVGVDSTPGSGTTVTVRLPVTMAIVKVLFVMVGDEQYGIPIKNIDEISQSDETERVDGQPVVEHDDEIYPVVHLADAFDVPDAKENGDGMLVRIRASERKVALQCDAVTQQEEVVVKPLEGVLTGTDGLSGTAVLGDGDIVHIIDVGTL